MALINCSECGKKVSNKAKTCPECGNPINLDSNNEVEKNELMRFPDIPFDLEIGEDKEHCIFIGFYDGNENTNTILPINGEVYVTGHVNGIKIFKLLKENSAFYKIHNSQIISLKQTTLNELSKTEKSVVGRAVVGGLILGPIGAIVGGMSGIGSKKKIIDKDYLVINYWEIETKSIQTLLISGSKNLISSFIKIYEGDEEHIKKLEEISNEGWTKESTYGLMFIIVIIAIVSFWLYYIFIK